MKPRLFWSALLLIALIGLILRVYVGAKTFLSFDEWQHVFMAASPRWVDLSYELRTNAHPPLFFLLLRQILRLGNPALYRSISIAAGAGSIVVVGLIARKVLSSPVLQLLCAAAFALSTDAISISDEIRSYQLCVFFVLLAFNAWLESEASVESKTRPEVEIRAWIAFAIFSSLAVGTHYFAAFFLGACVVVTLPRLRRMKRGSCWIACLSLAFPCAVFALAYVLHAGAQPMQGYLFDFYRSGTPGESVTSFLLRNSRNFFNLFSPAEIHNSAIFLPVLLLLVAAGICAFRRPLRVQAGAAVALAAVIVVELLAASLVNRYPFGGMLRHQYIAGPFLIVAVFVILDALIPLANPYLQRVIPAVILVICILNVAVGGPKLILYPGVVLATQEFNSWHSAFPDAHAIYLDHWSVEAYFIHTSTRPRQFVRRIPDDAVIDEFHIPDGTPEGTDIFYDKTRILADVLDPSVYRSLAACLRVSGAKELDLFYMEPGDKSIELSPAELERVSRYAAEQGMTVTRVDAHPKSLSAGFRLR